MGVRGDLVVDGESECKSFAACLRGNAGLCARANGIEEVFELEAKGFAFGDVGLGEGEAGGGVVGGCGRGGGGDCGVQWDPRSRRRDLGHPACRWNGGGSDGGGDDGWIDADGEEFLAGEVEREVLVGLEEAELADLFGGDAARGEIGDAA